MIRVADAPRTVCAGEFAGKPFFGLVAGESGELSPTTAYTNTKKATPKKAKAGAKKPKPFARVIRTSCGVTVELKAKKQPSVEDLVAALREALSVVEAGESKAA
jgi:hypothetical protein